MTSVSSACSVGRDDLRVVRTAPSGGMTSVSSALPRHSYTAVRAEADPPLLLRREGRPPRRPHSRGTHALRSARRRTLPFAGREGRPPRRPHSRGADTVRPLDRQLPSPTTQRNAVAFRFLCRSPITSQADCIGVSMPLTASAHWCRPHHR
jgi:hypothetical protein